MATKAPSSGELKRLLAKSPLPAEEITALIAARHWADLGKGINRQLSRRAVVETVMSIPATTRFARKMATEAAENGNGWEETSSTHYRSILALLEGVQDGGTGLIAPLARLCRQVARAEIRQMKKPLARLSTALRKGSGEDIQAALLRTWSARATLSFTPVLRKQFTAPLKRKIRDYTLGNSEKVVMETRFSDPVLTKLCQDILPMNTAAGTIKKALKSAHPALYGQINLAFKQAKLSTPLQRAALSRLLDSRLYTTMKAMVRKTAETESELETATIELKQAKVSVRNNVMKKLCTLGFGGNPEAKNELIKAKNRVDQLEERFERLDTETKILKRLLITYIQGAARALKVLAKSMSTRIKAEFTATGQETPPLAARTFAAGLSSLKLGAPSDEKFWQIVLTCALRDMTLCRASEIAAKLNADCGTVYNGLIPALSVTGKHGKSCIDMKVDMPDAGPNVFARAPEEMLDLIRAHTELYHSFNEKKAAAPALNTLKKQLDQSAETDDRDKAEIRFKVSAAAHLEKLKSLHSKERRRIKPNQVQNLLPEYKSFLENAATEEDLRYADHATELAVLIVPMASGLMGADGYGRITADGPEILLETEKIFLEKTGTPEENMQRVKQVFDTARTELLSLEPAILKQLTKKVPSLKRSMNFMSRDQKAKKEKKKNSVRG